MNEREEELRNADHLRNGIGHPYKAPDGYFDWMHDELLGKISTKPAKVSVFRTYVTRFAPAIVAIIVILIAVSRQDNKRMIAMDYDALQNSGLVSLDEWTLAEYASFPADTSTAFENYIIESISEEALIIEL